MCPEVILTVPTCFGCPKTELMNMKPRYARLSVRGYKGVVDPKLRYMMSRKVSHW